MLPKSEVCNRVVRLTMKKWIVKRAITQSDFLGYKIKFKYKICYLIKIGN